MCPIALSKVSALDTVGGGSEEIDLHNPAHFVT